VDVPAQYCPTAPELDDLELLLGGGFAPRSRFDEDGPVRLTLPPELRESAEGVELVDPEGLPLAHRAADGALTPLRQPEYGAFRRLHLPPTQVRADHEGALFVPLDRCPDEKDLALIGARREGRHVVLLALCGTGTPRGLTPVGLVRVALRTAELLGDTDVVAVPLSAHPDSSLRTTVVANYAAGEILDEVTGQHDIPAALAEIRAQDQPEQRGVVVFFTGLSGSGKSTLARALSDRLLEQGVRTVTSLDGDVVRRNLSKGLTFSREDRETNIRRIGWVAAEIARHHGVAICSPIAPFDATRKAVRQMVTDAGGEFILIHVATPLAECERRDRKGLYAKARAGQIPEFTGISSPYETPEDATAVVDTTGRTISEALADVIAVLPFPLETDA